ncbi:hypothetical protein KC19_2G045500 [Ceratodon purpureus]|uniref:Uncharacterized protein n=1 Tax=Ceratodon purpureus TaxID=3225 RepID=A0A8T0ISX1_CERPU|nr:hypothetical protein KC19_2G045500 [Ceratodon purpureus]
MNLAVLFLILFDDTHGLTFSSWCPFIFLLCKSCDQALSASAISRSCFGSGSHVLVEHI